MLKNNSQKAAKRTNNTWNSFIQIFVFDEVFVVAGMMKARASAKFLKGLMQSLEIKNLKLRNFGTSKVVFKVSYIGALCWNQRKISLPIILFHWSELAVQDLF